VEWVAAWWPAQPRWWVEFWDAAGHGDAPVGMVEEPVVAPAQSDTVADAGGAVIGPMDRVVNVGPAGGY
jgi:hypothetical protein